MRTVDKDDFLVARGANPRTGLITPDWNSVVSSLDNDERNQVARRDRPSAQWKLDGDAWISVPQENHLEDDCTSTTADPPMIDSQAKHTSNDQGQQSILETEQTAALTEKNLRTFSDQVQPEAQMQSALPNDGTPFQEVQIKRKPVANPSQVLLSKNMTRRARRDISGETVIHSPQVSDKGPPKRMTPRPHFSPDSVSMGMGILPNAAAGFHSQARNCSPFLGVPMEFRGRILPQPQGFTSKLTSRDQLQKSLRMSSGPYPSPPSAQRSKLEKGGQALHTLLDQRTQYGQQPDPRKGQQGLHQPVPTARRPDTSVSHSFTQPYLRVPHPSGIGLPNRKAQSHHTGKPIITLEADHQSPDSNKEVQTPWQPTTTYESFQNLGAIKYQQSVDKILSQQHDRTLLRPDTCLRQDHALLDGTQDLVTDHDLTIVDHPVAMDQHQATTDRRPQAVFRSQEPMLIRRSQGKEISMALKDQSNRTGTAAAHPSEDDIDDVIEELSESPEPQNERKAVTPASISPTAHSKVSNPDDNRKTSRQQTGKVQIAKDHSLCCPECCTEFDCHDGCLGHPSPNVSVVDSETSSLVPMGVFDANFETSVKAVNMALLTRADKSDSKLAKFRTALGWKPGSSSPTRSSPRPSLTRRTLRDEPLSQKVNIGLIRHPQPAIQETKKVDDLQARVAAVKAQDILHHSHKTSDNSNKARDTGNLDHHRKKKPREAQSINCELTEANKGRRIGGKYRKVSKNEADATRTTEHHDLCNTNTFKEEFTVHSDSVNSTIGLSSMLYRVNKFMRESTYIPRPEHIDPDILTSPFFLNHLRSFLIVLKDMSITIADTTSTLVAITFEYNRTGQVTVPRGTTVNEIAGNMLRTALYLMITACIYALCLKVGRAILAVLRFVLLPVRICAWIIG